MKSSKFYHKSLILPVLVMVRNGQAPKDIAKFLNTSPSLVAYYISRAKEEGFVKETFRDAFKLCELTQAGKNFLDLYEKNPQFLQCRAENIQFVADVSQMPTIPVDWEKIQMHNWVQYKSKVDSVRVRLNMGKKPTLEFLPSPVEGNDPFDIFVIMVVDCLNVILELDRKFGLRVERLRLGSRGEWVVRDLVARAYCKTNGQVTYDGIAKVNASKPLSFGELEYFDPRALHDYLLMPRRAAKIDATTERIEFMVNKLTQNSEFTKTQSDVALLSLFTMIFPGGNACGCPLSIF